MLLYCLCSLISVSFLSQKEVSVLDKCMNNNRVAMEEKNLEAV